MTQSWWLAKIDFFGCSFSIWRRRGLILGVRLCMMALPSSISLAELIDSFLLSSGRAILIVVPALLYFRFFCPKNCSCLFRGSVFNFKPSYFKYVVIAFSSSKQGRLLSSTVCSSIAISSESSKLSFWLTGPSFSGDGELLWLYF